MATVSHDPKPGSKAFALVKEVERLCEECWALNIQQPASHFIAEVSGAGTASAGLPG